MATDVPSKLLNTLGGGLGAAFLPGGSNCADWAWKGQGAATALKVDGTEGGGFLAARGGSGTADPADSGVNWAPIDGHVPACLAGTPAISTGAAIATLLVVRRSSSSTQACFKQCHFSSTQVLHVPL